MKALSSASVFVILAVLAGAVRAQEATFGVAFASYEQCVSEKQRLRAEERTFIDRAWDAFKRAGWNGTPETRALHQKARDIRQLYNRIRCVWKPKKDEGAKSVSEAMALIRRGSLLATQSNSAIRHQLNETFRLIEGHNQRLLGETNLIGERIKSDKFSDMVRNDVAKAEREAAEKKAEREAADRRAEEQRTSLRQAAEQRQAASGQRNQTLIPDISADIRKQGRCTHGQVDTGRPSSGACAMFWEYGGSKCTDVFSPAYCARNWVCEHTSAPVYRNQIRVICR